MATDTPAEVRQLTIYQIYPRNHGRNGTLVDVTSDLDRIAADDDADVPALSGWRRELFGDRALALKQGRLSLAIEKGRVVAVEHE